MRVRNHILLALLNDMLQQNYLQQAAKSSIFSGGKHFEVST